MGGGYILPRSEIHRSSPTVFVSSLRSGRFVRCLNSVYETEPKLKKLIIKI